MSDAAGRWALEIDGLDVHYGRVHALRGLTLTVGEGEIIALLGNNGAGKTSTLATVSGVVRSTGGTVRAFGRDITKAKPWEIVGAGLVHVPEGRRIFSRLTVHENLQLGGYLVSDKTVVSRRIDEVYTLLPRLAERRNQHGGNLSGGEQQMLAVGRALVAKPKLLMLDEPSMGLAPLVVAQIMKLIRQINADGTSVLLVEQNARAALKIAHRAYVVENGVITLQGPARELARDSRVVEAYLGA
ncbi:ABC transporter ATP-binding protein [Micromonospora avicenniae]|uniref:Amino acid/amide ABC transporter ATP-binding protein 2, HAAT family n=1 Tax=Micromonospora avicenniae TaxID=1198245 RepID=A0A1N7F528_9ACTN|nr:ABC transporter ATP-binding protein [Micromonospora avicenniae]SIR95467.1 amino acid/amide ABC transporter ATP-binding protein 2, HAAT family [Micromonospora avicenniae]